MPDANGNPINKSIAELDKITKDLLAKFPRAIVRYKYTCELCGSRRTFEKPFTIYEYGECECGHHTKFVEGGMEVEIPLDKSARNANN